MSMGLRGQIEVGAGSNPRTGAGSGSGLRIRGTVIVRRDHQVFCMPACTQCRARCDMLSVYLGAIVAVRTNTVPFRWLAKASYNDVDI